MCCTCNAGQTCACYALSVEEKLGALVGGGNGWNCSKTSTW